MSRLRVIVCLTTENGASRLKSPLPSREKRSSSFGYVAQSCDVKSSTTAGIRYVRLYYFEFISHAKNRGAGKTIAALSRKSSRGGLEIIIVQSGGEDSDIICHGPLSQSSRISMESNFPKMFDPRRHWVRLVLSWLLIWFLDQHLTVHSPKRLQSLKDHIVQRATDRRRNVVEVNLHEPLFSCLRTCTS